MELSLVTLGDPFQVTGGYLYHLRMAAAAPTHGASISFRSLTQTVLPLSAPEALRLARDTRACDAVLLDSIAAARLALSAGMLKAPLVVVAHQPPGGIDRGPLGRAVQGLLDRRAYRGAAGVIAASDDLGAEFGRLGFGPVEVVPPGSERPADVVPARRGSADVVRARVGASDVVPARVGADGRVVVLCVGNWLARKGILELLEAVAGVPAGWELHLVGDDGADRRYARRVRARLGRADVRGRVVVHGALRREQVEALYAAADVFVLPSSREPYGTVYAEAMAAGLPVVGWRAGNIVNLARHEQEGLLVEPGDVEGLREALGRLIRDEQLRTRLGEGAARRAESFPTWDESAARFFAAVRRFIAGPRSSG